MSEPTTPPPPAGWYPDPEVAGHERYWDGALWSARRVTQVKAPAFRWEDSPLGAAPALSRGWLRLGVAVRVGLALSVVALVAQALVSAWGLSMFEDALVTGDIARLERFDDLDFATSVALVVVMIATGIGWMVWQYQFARAVAPGSIRRGPGWHAWAWVTPVVGLWFPYQNVKDLWVRRQPTTALLPLWWTAYLTMLVLDRAVSNLIDEAETVSDFKTLLGVDLAASLAGILAGILAIRVHQALSAAEAAEAAGPVT